jgi:hypothetical protein
MNLEGLVDVAPQGTGVQTAPVTPRFDTLQDLPQEKPKLQEAAWWTKAARWVMAGNVVESINRDSYLLKKMGTSPQPGEKVEDYNKRWDAAETEYNNQRESKGFVSQLEVPMMGAIASGAAAAPLTTAKFVGGFTLKNMVWNPREFIDKHYPDTSPWVKDLVEVGDMIATGGAIAGADSIAAKTFIMKSLNDLGLPQKFNLTRENVADTKQVLTEKEHKDFMATLGVEDKHKQAMDQTGLHAVIPDDKMLDLAKKPYWSKVRDTFVKPQEPKIEEVQSNQNILKKGWEQGRAWGVAARQALQWSIKGFNNTMQSAFPVIQRFGGEAYVNAQKAINEKAVAQLAFDNQMSKVFNDSFNNLKAKFASLDPKVLKDLMITRGKASTPEARAMQEAARARLPEDLQDPNIQAGLTEIYDYNFKVARDSGIEMEYFQDYIRGAYKDKGKAKKFLNFWKSTDSFTNKKQFPTYADAVEFDPTLELRDFNPIANAESEIALIGQRVGMMKLRESYGLDTPPKPAAAKLTPTVKVGLNTETGKTHAEALSKLGLSKDNLVEGKQYEAGFTTEEGKFITREESMKPPYNLATGHSKAIPDFKSTDEALSFGFQNKGKSSVAKRLYKKIDQIEARIKKLQSKKELTPEEESKMFTLAQKKQFPREALQALAGKISKEDLARIKTKIGIDPETTSYVVRASEASKEQRASWETINDPLLEDLLFDPDYAKYVNNLIETNKVSGQPVLNIMRSTARVAQWSKFFGSVFHMLNMGRAAISDEAWGIFDPRGYANIGKAFKGIDTKSPEYSQYVGLVGRHTSAVESEATTSFNNALKTVTKGWSEKASGIYKKSKYIPGSPEFVKWMFDSYIPAMKYNKWQQEISYREGKLGRRLTDYEKTEIGLTIQNFYGEMNEKLLGRSGTATSAMRILFSAPGYGEGNYRSIFGSMSELKALFPGQKSTPSGFKNTQFIATSMFNMMVLAGIGTRIMTGRWPGVPKTGEDVRDLMKIQTNQVDGDGNPVFYDMAGYTSDYFAVYGNLATGQAGRVPGAVMKRISGAQSQVYKTLVDLAQISAGEVLRDYKGEPVYQKTDDYATKVAKFMAHEGMGLRPISAGTLIESKKKGAGLLTAAGTALVGIRATTSERVKTLKDAREDVYSIENAKKPAQNDFDKLYNENPDEAVKQAQEFNKEQAKKLKTVIKRIGVDKVKEVFGDNLKELENKFFISSAKGQREVKGIEESIKDLFSKTPRVPRQQVGELKGSAAQLWEEMQK